MLIASASQDGNHVDPKLLFDMSSKKQVLGSGRYRQAILGFGVKEKPLPAMAST
jgi:hypothetical protein